MVGGEKSEGNVPHSLPQTHWRLEKLASLDLDEGPQRKGMGRKRGKQGRDYLSP